MSFFLFVFFDSRELDYPNCWYISFALWYQSPLVIPVHRIVEQSKWRSLLRAEKKTWSIWRGESPKSMKNKSNRRRRHLTSMRAWKRVKFVIWHACIWQNQFWAIKVHCEGAIFPDWFCDNLFTEKIYFFSKSLAFISFQQKELWQRQKKSCNEFLISIMSFWHFGL